MGHSWKYSHWSRGPAPNRSSGSGWSFLVSFRVLGSDDPVCTSSCQRTSERVCHWKDSWSPTSTPPIAVGNISPGLPRWTERINRLMDQSWFRVGHNSPTSLPAPCPHRISDPSWTLNTSTRPRSEATILWPLRALGRSHVGSPSVVADIRDFGVPVYPRHCPQSPPGRWARGPRK